MTFSPIGQVRHSTHRDTKGDTGLDTARTLIQSILDQVSTNDSPHIGTFDDHNNNINNINNIYPTSTIQNSTNGSAIPDKGGSNTITASTLKRFISTNSGSSATNTTTWTASQGSSSHLGGSGSSGNGGFGAIPGSSNRVSRQRHILPEPMSMVPPSLNSTTVGSTGTIPQSQQNTNSQNSEMTSATTTI